MCREDDTIIFPEGFMCIGGKSFEWVYENRAEFVDFTINEMENPTKMFLTWYNYCLFRQNELKR